MRSCFSAGASSLTQVPCEQCVIAATSYTNLGFDISNTAQFCGLILALAVFLSGWPSLCKAVYCRPSMVSFSWFVTSTGQLWQFCCGLILWGLMSWVNYWERLRLLPPSHQHGPSLSPLLPSHSLFLLNCILLCTGRGLVGSLCFKGVSLLWVGLKKSCIGSVGMKGSCRLPGAIF